MLNALTLILACQLSGEIITQLLAAPVPGPVLGMLLLLFWIMLRGGIPDELGRAADILLGQLSLLFVPAGVGVMLHWQRLQAEWLAIAVALVIGTLITLAITALTMSGVQYALARLARRRGA